VDWFTFRLRHRAGNVLGEVKNVVPLSVVRVQEGLDMSPRALHRVRKSHSTLIDESDRVWLTVWCV
jgi:hypothetical protein